MGKVLRPVPDEKLEALDPARQLAVTFGAGLTLLRVVVPVRTFQSLLPPLVADAFIDVGVTIESETAQLNDLAGTVRSPILRCLVLVLRTEVMGENPVVHDVELVAHPSG